MKPQPKHKRIKLNPADYRKLKREIWLNALGCCELCGLFVRFDDCHLHHKKSRGAGGDDSRDNCIALCPTCHVLEHGPRWSK